MRDVVESSKKQNYCLKCQERAFMLIFQTVRLGKSDFNSLEIKLLVQVWSNILAIVVNANCFPVQRGIVLIFTIKVVYII